MNTCTQCSASLQPGAAFCDTCGASVAHSAPTLVAGGSSAAPPAAPAKASSADQCPECTATIIPGQAFCEDCGISLANVGLEPTQPPVAAPVQAQAPVAPAPTPRPAAPAPAPQGKTCSNCGTVNAPNHGFCDNCGTSLAQAAAPPPAPVQPKPPVPPVTPPPPVTRPPVAAPPRQPAPPPPPAKKAKLTLTSSGTDFPFGNKMEILIGREDPISGIFPEVDLTYHGGVEGGVSRRHAKLMKQGDQWVVQDLKSTNHTYINRRRLTPGKPEPLNHGDQLRVGRLVFTFDS